MNNPTERLIMAIDKIESKKYDTTEFHLTIESIIHSITSAEMENLRSELLKFESELEYIDFMVNKNERMQSYLDKIRVFKQLLKI